MIAHVRGEVAHRDAETVVVDVGGIGWRVYVADLAAVPPVGEPVVLHTSMQVREDAMDLYGFTDRDGLATFDLLIQANGVGPRLALAALRTHRPGVLRDAIALGDATTLTAVPGIGKKVAQRLILELGEKVTSVDRGGGGGATAATATADATAMGEAQEALTQLGYSAVEIRAALAGAPAEGSVEDLVRHALRHGGGR